MIFLPISSKLFLQALLFSFKFDKIIEIILFFPEQLKTIFMFYFYRHFLKREMKILYNNSKRIYILQIMQHKC